MFRSDRILALDIGASKLSLGEFRPLPGGSLELVRYAVVALGVNPDATPDPSAYIVSALREALRGNDMRPGPALVSLSGQMVFPRYVRLPPVTPDKIPSIVRYEAQQNVPFPIEEVVWDYQLIGQNAGDLSVMLVAVKGDVVKNLTDCVEAAGLEPAVVDVAPMALYNAVRYNYTDLPGCTMILDMGGRSTNVVFVEAGRIFSRSIPVAGLAITKELMKEFDLSFEDAEQLKLAHAFVGFGGTYEGSEVGVADRTSKIVRNVMTRLHAEITQTINFYRSQQGGGQPALVLLAGGCATIRHVDTFLKDKLKVEVDYLNPFRNVSVGAEIPAERIAKDVHRLGEIVGLALRRVHTCPVEINLLPPDLVARKTFQRRLPFLGVAAGMVVFIMLVLGLFLHVMRGLSEKNRVAVQSRLAELAAPNARLQEIERKKAEVDARVAQLVEPIRQRALWLAVFEDLHNRLVPGMWLTSVRPASRAPNEPLTRLEIKGMAFNDKVSHQAIMEFADALKGGRHFAGPGEIKRIRPVTGTDYATEFVMELAMKTPGGAPANGPGPGE